MKTKKPKKIEFSAVLNKFVSILLVLSVLICAQVVWQVSQKGYVSLMNTSVFRVITGSMEPTMPVGTILLSKETAIEDIEVGDIVCFKALNSYIEDSVITHRVISVSENEDGEIELYTKGDANTAVDGYTVTEANLIGKVTWYSEEDSIIANIIGGLTSSVGLLSFVILPCLFISALIMGDAVKNIRKELVLLREAEAAEESATEISVIETYEEMELRILKELKEELMANGGKFKS